MRKQDKHLFKDYEVRTIPREFIFPDSGACSYFYSFSVCIYHDNGTLVVLLNNSNEWRVQRSLTFLELFSVKDLEDFLVYVSRYILRTAISNKWLDGEILESNFVENMSSFIKEYIEKYRLEEVYRKNEKKEKRRKDLKNFLCFFKIK